MAKKRATNKSSGQKDPKPPFNYNLEFAKAAALQRQADENRYARQTESAKILKTEQDFKARDLKEKQARYTPPPAVKAPDKLSGRTPDSGTKSLLKGFKSYISGGRGGAEGGRGSRGGGGRLFGTK